VTVVGKCFFRAPYSCSEEILLAQASIHRVLQASKLYENGLHLELERKEELGVDFITVH